MEIRYIEIYINFESPEKLRASQPSDPEFSIQETLLNHPIRYL